MIPSVITPAAIVSRGSHAGTLATTIRGMESVTTPRRRTDPLHEFEALLRQLEAEAEALVAASTRHPDGELYAMGRLRGLQEALACVSVIAGDARRRS